MNNYYDILNIKPDATKTEVVESYQRLKKIFSEESNSIYGLFSPHMLSEKIQEIELAYQILSEGTKREKYDEELQSKEIVPITDIEGVIPIKTYKKIEEEVDEKRHTVTIAPDEKTDDKPKPEKIEGPLPNLDDEEPFRGKTIEKLRKHKNITLDQISQETKIKVQILLAIENEEFDLLPAKPYLRGFLTHISRIIGIKPERLIRDYIFLYDKWKNG
ncbi:MAG: helix-turn-helix domain-containing protein [Acidobacteria bacterium]|nr:helix-turn-helix domain-containing protein [Acidobacteriota bacterium]